MTTRGQVLRSSITGNVPATNSRWPGEIWSNFPDKQIGVIDASKVAQPLVGVRFFSTNANYVAGDFVVQGGGIYRAKVAVTVGAFNATQWAQVGGSVLVSDTPPGGANPGDLWFDSVGGQLFVYYNDGNTSQWVVASNQNVGGLFLPLTGGALSGALTINNAVAGTASLQVNAPNGPANITLNSSQGQFRNIVGQTSGSLRWSMALGDNTAESGSNAGSDFTLTAASDDLSTVYTPFSINRATGVATFVSSASFGGNIQVNGGSVSIKAPSSGNSAVQFQDNTGATKGYCYWDAPTGSVRLYNVTAGAQFTINSNNTFTLNGGATAATGSFTANGIQCRQGLGGALANMYNFYWTSVVMEVWVDSTKIGSMNITSDYRTKKDIEELPSMWETLKALRPIKYTQAEFSPPSAMKEDGGEPDAPLFKNDDEERWGFVAHELQETLVQSAASGVKDAPDEIQCPNPWTVIATLTKALQEAMTRIEALEAGAGA